MTEWLRYLSARVTHALGLAAVVLGWAVNVHAQQYAYVAHLGSNSVSVIDTRTSGIVATIPAGDSPDGVAATPDGRFVYVTNFLSDDVSVIDTATNTVSTTVAVGSGPVGIAITPNGAAAYVTNRGSNTVTVIDTATNTANATIVVGAGPNAIAITPDGAFAYVTNSFSNAPGTVSVIDLASNGLVATIEVGRNPNRLAISPDGAFAYVTNFRSWNVSVIAIAARTVATTLPVFGRPTGVAINPNGADLYVVTLGGRVEIISTDTNTLDADVEVGDSPYGIATTRNGGLAYVANFGDGTVSVIDLAAASASTKVTVGAKPFAIALSCKGSSCSEPPFTPRPTRTPTMAPTVTTTPPPTPTEPPNATPVRPPTPLGPQVKIVVGSATGHAGEQVSVSVTLRTSGNLVGGVENDIGFEADAPIAIRTNGKPDCTVNPNIDKNATAFGFRPLPCTPGIDCTAIRALVLSIDNTDPIPDTAVLYTCRVAIAANASVGAHPLRVVPFSAIASDVHGTTALPVVATDGTITVIAPSSRAAAAQSATTSGSGCAIGSGERGMPWQLLVTAVVLAWRRRSLACARRNA